MKVQSLALPSGLRILHHCGYGVGSSYNSDSTPRLGSSISRGYNLKKKTDQKKRKISKNMEGLSIIISHRDITDIYGILYKQKNMYFLSV